jgi:SAM-dependent methyltransferase
VTATPVDFEARYRADADPWGYTHSRYEREKYAATLVACGRGRDGLFTCALELGGSIGVFSAMLAPRCRRLVTVDGAPTAVAVARRRLAGRARAEVVLGQIPEAVPEETFDLVVASEVLYYLPEERLAATLEMIRDRTHRGARLVAVHWRPAGPERPFDANTVHTRLREQPWLHSRHRTGIDQYLLDVLERR